MNNELKIPNHVAIIVDGNGRWAKERGLPRIKGHDEGYKRLKQIGEYALKKGVKVLSLYVFSTENFKREQAEVNHLMDLFVRKFRSDKNFFNDRNIKVIFSGRDEPLPKSVIDARNELAEMTKDNTGGILNVCLNYGGRAEIVDAVKKIVRSGIDIEKLDEKEFGKYLYNDLPDVDLMIRTSGEIRLSNFLLWQNSYAEMYFPETKFPDFKEEDFDEAIEVYNNRDRRFGGHTKKSS